MTFTKRRLFSGFLSIVAAFGAFSLFQTLALCQDAPDRQKRTIRWESNLDEGFLAAKKSGRPVLVLFYVEKSAADSTMLDELVLDPDVVTLSRKFLCLAAAKEEHEDVVRRLPDGITKTVCSRFPTMPCGDHQFTWLKAVRSFFLGDEPTTTQILFVKPTGDIMSSREGKITPRDLSRAMKKILDKMKPERDDDVFSVLDDEEELFVRDLSHLKGATPSRRRFILEKLVRSQAERAYVKLWGYFDQFAGKSVRLQIIREMGFPGNQRAVPGLLEMAKQKDPGLRLHAAVSLEEIALAETLKGVQAWLAKEKEIKVQATLLRTLAACDPGNPQVLKRLRKESGSGKPLVRCNATVALGIVGRSDPEAARELLHKLASDRDRNVAACACWALGEMRSRDSLDLLRKKMEEARKYRMIILLEDAIHRAMGLDTFAYPKHLEKYAGDEVVRGEKWPPERPDWGVDVMDGSKK